MSAPSSPSNESANDPSSRRSGRVRCRMTFCDLGEIVDLSAKGARVRARRRPRGQAGDLIGVTIQGLDGPIEVQARLAWVRRAGFFRHEFGLEFEGVTESATRALS